MMKVKELINFLLHTDRIKDETEVVIYDKNPELKRNSFSDIQDIIIHDYKDANGKDCIRIALKL